MRIKNIIPNLNVRTIKPSFGIHSQIGITSITLIVTTIIMLIQAGVTISTVINEGLFEQSPSAREEFDKADFRERVEIDIVSVVTELYVDEQEVNLQNVIAILITNEYGYILVEIDDVDDDNVENITEGTEKVTITKDGRKAEVNNNLKLMWTLN